jgi:hypothetical protein
MAACPVALTPSSRLRRRPIVVSRRRIEANRRNAARSTGPRTPNGKARVARNAIKHGFFVAPARWTPEQHRDFVSTLDGLRDDFKSNGIGEESCVWTIAHSYVRMASVLRYETIAAYEEHQRYDREFDARIAAADTTEAARLRNHREKLRLAGLWRPTIPGPREANAIIRYMGSLDRTIRHATSELHGLKSLRNGGRFGPTKLRKQSHYSASPNRGPEAARGASTATIGAHENAKTNPLRAAVSNGPEALRRTSDATCGTGENAKTNPLSSMFTGNRHARRRAKAMARRRT